jgi:gamma-glutamylcyclotransferase (GGCT)/AIG2-like uncharacterized protein YtfP
MASMYYWAYGSNLSKRAMMRRCPAARPVAPLVLEGALVFRGVADVIGRKGSKVAGGLWLITPECEHSLDRYEGVSARLYNKEYLTLEIDGKVQQVLYYQMTDTHGVMPPSEGYLDVIMEGYRDFGLDIALLDNALHRAWGHKRKTPFLRERRKRRGGGRLATPDQLWVVS